jgi:hypothetical protein
MGGDPILESSSSMSEGGEELTSLAAKKYYSVFVTCLILGIYCLSMLWSKVWKRIFRPKEKK